MGKPAAKAATRKTSAKAAVPEAIVGTSLELAPEVATAPQPLRATSAKVTVKSTAAKRPKAPLSLDDARRAAAVPADAASKPTVVTVLPPARPLARSEAGAVAALAPAEAQTAPSAPEAEAAAPEAEAAKTAAVKSPPARSTSRKAPRPLDLSSATLRRPVGASLVNTPPKSVVAKAIDGKAIDAPSTAGAEAGAADKDRATAFAPTEAANAVAAEASAAQTIVAKAVAAPSVSARAAVPAPPPSMKVALAEPGVPSSGRSLTDAAPGGVHALIAHHAAANGVPVDLATAVVRVESRFNPRARNGANVGLTQISTATARSLGYQGGAQGLMDADTNLRFGIRYLAQAYRLAGGDTCRTVLKYQAGHRASTMTGAARAYCAKVKPHVSRR